MSWTLGLDSWTPGLVHWTGLQESPGPYACGHPCALGPWFTALDSWTGLLGRMTAGLLGWTPWDSWTPGLLDWTPGTPGLHTLPVRVEHPIVADVQACGIHEFRVTRIDGDVGCSPRRALEWATWALLLPLLARPTCLPTYPPNDYYLTT